MSPRKPSSGGSWPAAPEIAPALLAAIAEVLRVPAEELTAAAGDHDPAAMEIQAAAATPQFAGLARRWAKASGQSLADAREVFSGSCWSRPRAADAT